MKKILNFITVAIFLIYLPSISMANVDACAFYPEGWGVLKNYKEIESKFCGGQQYDGFMVPPNAIFAIEQMCKNNTGRLGYKCKNKHDGKATAYKDMICSGKVNNMVLYVDASSCKPAEKLP